ncbi:SRPBCC family protein [Muricoccus vinaceus]|uniref:Carbon monoxide dehydrogenase subunit G n=1 Tax=Muricoccus vinaceus TaxID=424704 RepID=A0ABV6IKZ0_9PROT
MDMTGSRHIEAPRQRVWEALNDPAVLQAAIPGCESVERTGDDSFAAKVAVRIGPMSAKFGGKVTLTNVRPPEGYTITGEGSGGAMGFARGGADVALVEEGPEATTLNYTVKAQVGGKMAQLGARLVDSTARQMADQFFDRFAAQLAPAPAAIPATHTTAPDSMASTDTVPTAPRPDGSPISAGRTATAALRPANAKRTIWDTLDAIPRQPMGLPINLWIGGAVMLGVLTLLFVVG